jgi:hypothetical protein
MSVTLRNEPMRIVATRRHDDGTTLGQNIYIDDLGGRWVDSPPSTASSTYSSTRIVDRNGYFVRSARAY